MDRLSKIFIEIVHTCWVSVDERREVILEMSLIRLISFSSNENKRNVANV